MKYSEIKTIDELDRAQEQLKVKLGRKDRSVRSSFMDVREAYTPSGLMRTGLRSAARYVPLDQVLLYGVRKLKRKLKKL